MQLVFFNENSIDKIDCSRTQSIFECVQHLITLIMDNFYDKFTHVIDLMAGHADKKQT